MKALTKFTLVIAINIICYSLGFSQIKSPSEVRVAMSKGTANGWKIFVPKNDAKMLQAGWRKFCKNYDARVEKIKKTDEYLAELVSIPSIGATTYNLYAQFEETPEGSYLITFLEIGGGFLNSHQHKEESKEWSRLMKELAKTLTLEAIEDEIQEEEKILKDENKDLDRLIKDKRSYENDISDCEKTIEDRKKQIETNVKDQATKKSEITEQETQVKRVKDEFKKYSN